MSMLDDWPTGEEQDAALARGCTCTAEMSSDGHPMALTEQDAYCVEHGDRMIMRATIDKLRVAIGEAFVRRFL